MDNNMSKITLSEIKKYLENKNICLLGNSESILNNKKDIDKYDIICRINGATSQGKENYIGSRTDILFIATRFIENLKQKFKATHVIWLTECRKLATDWILKNALQNPIEDWRELKSLVPNDKLPSTGILAIQFLLNYIKFKSLTIYGFDFFETGDHYRNCKKFPWHDGKFEKETIMKWIKERENVRIVIE